MRLLKSLPILLALFLISGCQGENADETTTSKDVSAEPAPPGSYWVSPPTDGGIVYYTEVGVESTILVEFVPGPTAKYVDVSHYDSTANRWETFSSLNSCDSVIVDSVRVAAPGIYVVSPRFATVPCGEPEQPIMEMDSASVTAYTPTEVAATYSPVGDPANAVSIVVMIDEDETER